MAEIVAVPRVVVEANDPESSCHLPLPSWKTRAVWEGSWRKSPGLDVGKKATQIIKSRQKEEISGDGARIRLLIQKGVSRLSYTMLEIDGDWGVGTKKILNELGPYCQDHWWDAFDRLIVAGGMWDAELFHRITGAKFIVTKFALSCELSREDSGASGK